MSAEYLAKLEAQRKEAKRQEALKAEARRLKLAEFTTRELWLELHDRMSEEHKVWWEVQGIPREMQNFWHLGHTPNKVFLVGQEKHSSPAYTIPLFHHGWKFQTMQYRLTHTFNGSGRYRPESDLGNTYFVSRPDLPADYKVAVVLEGSKKAMVVDTTINKNGEMFQCYGTPSENWWAGLDFVLGDVDRVYIVPDPSSWIKPKNADNDWLPYPVQFARKVGDHARICRVPVKPDDMITCYGADAPTFKNLFKYAARA